MHFFQLSAAGSILILLILAVRVLAIRRLPKTTFLVLWEIAALRLLLPLSVSLPLPGPAGVPFPAGPIQEQFVGHADLSESDPTVSSHDAGAGIAGQVTKPIPVLTALWLSGAAAAAICFSVSYLRYIRRFRMSLPDHTPCVQEWLAAHRSFRPIEVRYSDLISAPLTYGVLRPVILLPKRFDRSNAAALKYVLTHEYVHIRRFDAVAKILFTAVLCIHWFNPLVWAMYRLAGRDMELSCDACVVRITGEKDRAAYAFVLLHMEERRNGMTPFCSNFSENPMEERIEAIMKYKRFSVVAVALSLMLAVGAAAAFVSPSAPASAPEHSHSASGTGGLRETAEAWAEALKNRDGLARFALMASDSKAAYYDALKAQNGEENPWTIGVSSPYVVSYDVQVSDDAAAVITYRMETSEPEEYVYQEELLLQEEEGKTAVREYTVTVPCLRKDLYEEALAIQKQVKEGHQTWRLTPESVALEFVYRDWGAESGKIISVSGDDVVFQTGDGQQIQIKVYRPINTSDGFYAVYSYSVEGTHYILHNKCIC